MSSAEEFIVEALGHRAQTGRLEGLTIEYWVGGGQPPPYYRSDQLRLLAVDGRDTLELAKARYDAGYTPPTVVDKWRLHATEDDVRRMSRLLVGTKVFEAHHPEETKPPIADILSTEVTVTAGDKKAERRYFRQVPTALDPLRAAAEALMGRLERDGTHGLYHQGKPIGA